MRRKNCKFGDSKRGFSPSHKITTPEEIVIDVAVDQSRPVIRLYI